jgi:O-antigen ligase/tetratricopeptide (TPR) repeat protein
VALAFSTGLLVNFTLPKLLCLRVGVLLLLLIWVYRIRRGEVRTPPRIVLYSGIVLGAWWILTTFFALHMPTALHGVYGRYNGLLTHETWLLLFFVVASIPMDMKRVERILKLFIVPLIPVSIYAILQFLGVDFASWVALEGRSASTIGHPVMLAALLGLALPFVITFFFRAETNWWRICWTAIFFLFLVAVATAGSRGPLLGIIAGCSIVIVVHVRNRIVSRKWLLYGSLAMAILLCALLLVPGNAKKMADRLSSGGEVKLRLMYYKTTLNMMRDYPVLGAGFEHFRILYPRYRPPEDNKLGKDVVPTMVHNGYLQAAVTNGIPGAFLYLVFIGSILFTLAKAYKRKTDTKERLLLLSFFGSILGFLIQDLTGWLEISLTTFFWIILGLAVSFCLTGKEKSVLTGWKRPVVLAMAVLFSVGFLYLVMDAANRTEVNRLFFKAQMQASFRPWKEVEMHVLEGLEGQKDDFYYEDMAGTIYTRRFVTTGDPAAFKQGAQLYERARLHNPYDVYVLVHRIELETHGLRRNVVSAPSPFVKEAEKSMVEMDKNNPTVYEAMTKLRIAEKRVPEALMFLGQAKALEGDHSRYYLLEGDVYSQLKEHGKAIIAYKEAVSLSERKKPYPPEWMMAKYGYVLNLVQSGDSKGALEEVKALVSLYPDNATLRIVMGEVYASLKDFEKAKDAFLSALRIEPSNQLARTGYLRAQELATKK